MKRIRKGDIVQITDRMHIWFPALVIVEKLGATIIEGYAPGTGADEAKNLSIGIEQLEPVGTAKITRALPTPKKEEKS